MTTAKEDEKAYAAFEEYRQAKFLVEKTMRFRDAETAAAAWVRFLNHYLPADHRMPAAKVIPLHRRTVQ